MSGVDNEENFKYLLEQNLRINGHSTNYVELIVSEWIKGIRITHSGGSYEAYQNATSNLGKNEFWLRFTNGGITEDGYHSYQKTFMHEKVEEEPAQRPVGIVAEAPAEDLATYAGRKAAALSRIAALQGQVVTVTSGRT